MSMPWQGLGLVYMFPPTKLLQEVLSRIRTTGGLQVILIAPKRPTASWFPDLVEIHTAVMPLPSQRLLSQVVPGLRERQFRNNVGYLSLHAWKL